MAITTMNGLVAGLKPPVFFNKRNSSIRGGGYFYSGLYISGFPGPGVAPTGNGLSGVALTSYPGQLPFSNPAGGELAYLSKFEASGGADASNAASIYLLDRLWHNDSIGVTTTGAQTINSVTLPARDENGTTDGVGVMAALEFSAAATNASAITGATITYTNSDGVGSRTGTTLTAIPSNPNAYTMVPFALQGTDKGIRSIQSLTLGTSLVTGTVHLVMYRELARCDSSRRGDGSTRDFIKTGLARLFDNTVPFLAVLPTTTAVEFIIGSIGYAHG